MNSESNAASLIATEHDRFNRMLFEALPIGLAICDMTGKMVYINEAFAAIIGHTVKDALELTYWEVTPQSYEPQEQEQLKSLQSTGKYGPYEKDYIHKDGHLVPVRLNGVLINENGEDYIWSSVEDVSEKRHAEERLVDAMHQAESANRIKNEFLASVSHELRTPLNAILGFSSAMSEEVLGPLANDQYRQYVDDIQKSGGHLLELVEDILDLSKLEANALELNLKPIPVSEVVGEVLHLVHQPMKAMGISFVDECTGDEHLRVVADTMRLKQVLLNLFSNAIKYNHQGGEVWFGCSVTEGGMVRIWVRDTGRGIPASMHARVFEPFSRLGMKATDIEGTGIGLSICQRLVAGMGGKIGFESEEGVGSTFWVQLPLATG